MKRCSMCDFIYEDDQNLCDMDGRELLYEPTLHALQLTAPTQPPASPVKYHAKQYAFAAATAIFMAAVFLVGHSGFTRELAPQLAPQKGSTDVISAPQSVPALVPTTPVVSPTPSPSQSPQSTQPQETTVTATRAATAANAPERSPTVRREVKRPQPAMANHKKESTIGGLLKKTGRILKKPFKRL